MKIQSVSIRNFRLFDNFQLDLQGRSVFVIAENGGGKSSLLAAIARGCGRDQAFTHADFADATRPIEIELTLSDLSVRDQAAFANWVDFGTAPSLRLATRAVWDDAAEEVEVEHGYARQPGSRSRRAERDALPLQWLPAARDPARQLQFGSPQSLIGTALTDLPIGTSLDQAIAEIRDASRRLGLDAALTTLLDDARVRLGTLLPDVSPTPYSMGVAALTSRDLLRQFELHVSHLGAAVPVPKQSSGVAQLSIFVFAMILVAADPGRILLVDEPELSLHPQSQRALMRALRQLDAQLIVATHSANLLDRADPRDVIRLIRRPSLDVASPILSDGDAARLARFTSPQTAEAFFAKSVILVEGMSDQIALEAVAERRGRNLDSEGVSIVPIGGATAINSHLDLFGPHGFRLDIAGLCDEAEQPIFGKALERVGLAGDRSEATMAASGFFVCKVDLEDELIRALGAPAVIGIIDVAGDLPAWTTFQQQPSQSGLMIEAQLRGFISKGRKIEYASRFVDALDLAAIPSVLDGVLAHV